MNLITLENVAIGYHRQAILTQLCLALETGAITCLLGANGCGKTTLMKTLLGLIPAIEGRILLKEKPLSTYKSSDIAKVIAYVPQAHDTPFTFTVIDMVMMGLSPHISLFSAPRAKERALGLQQLNKLGIAHLESRLYCTLSGGEKQLVLIARALIQNPIMLIMDEPAASLDFGNQIRLLTQVEQLKAHGMTIFMSTHHPQHAAAIADNVILLDKAYGARQGSAQSMLTLTNLAKLYSTDEKSIATHFQFPTHLTC
ncbi:ABC transporter ATP-binding protein [Providencia vermicola]|uniref:ABC transporter ATP-binding protein n=1 Tax=Providencia stuartii TaxID=588 RepID=A0AAI9HYJ7_PROST|nr:MULTISPECIES: ABC transporter ATP-binding protein [unclassified Providencia]ELR5035101.1 ABC transporter ATP-binding protein [Providencia stuartii]MTB39408.1 ATP-binding cassette domain-containing protein [Providencia sp. wls1949]MTC06545.1 ATP-binding cassette domain-containing protein [Providencia sp. wls1948]WBA56701.1 ABC transporter ATP-binding protein [Providencia sp. 21OH12SH02B-Prov]